MAKVRMIFALGIGVCVTVICLGFLNSTKELKAMSVVRHAISSETDWDGRFWFVPNNVESCTELFKGKIGLPSKFIEEYNQYETAFRKISHRTQPGDGFTAQVPSAYRAYLELASHPSVKTICETGFNGGHSTFGWLTVNPHAHVYSFDIGLHPYAKPMAEYLQRLFPGRLDVKWGDSTKTLPDFRRQHPNITCDLMIIDGGHTTPICKSDLLNFRLMASTESLVLLDNYPQKSWNFEEILGDVWEWAKRNSIVSEIFKCQVKDTIPDFGFSVGRYI